MQDERNVRKPQLMNRDEPEEITRDLQLYGWERAQLFSSSYFFFSGDYKKIGIKRVGEKELITSLMKHTAIQLQYMIKFYDVSILLIEGGTTPFSQEAVIDSMAFGPTTTGILLEGYRNFLRSWQDRGVTIEETITRSDTIARINQLYCYYQRPGSTGALVKKRVRDPRCQAFPPSVGEKTGEEILRILGNLQAVANADTQTLWSIPGIGQKRAEAIISYYTRNTAEIQA